MYASSSLIHQAFPPRFSC